MLTKTEINAIAQRVLSYGNPYKEQAEELSYKGEPIYMWNGKLYSSTDMDEMYLETARKDIKAGYDQRKVGYYDKWYRYNHADEGRAYDAGCQRATEDSHVEDMFIIECMH